MALVPLTSVVSSFLVAAVVATFLLFPTSKAQVQPLGESCNDNNDNYTINSTYYTNLNILISSLSLNGSVDGFADGTVGTVPDRVYGLVLCRGDVDNTTCKACIDLAHQDVLDRCQFKKAVTIWYDNCLLRYSNERFASADGGGGVIWYMKNSHNISSVEWPRFNQSLVNMLDKLIQYAAYNTSAPSPLMFATAEAKFDGEFPMIYGLVQCTRDLSPDTCNQCLMEKIGRLNACCGQRRGGRVLAKSCNFRYEVYSFYSGTPRISLQAIAAMSPAPTPSLFPLPPPFVAQPPTSPTTTNSTNTNPDGKRNKKGTGIILAIAIPTGVAFVLLLLCFACCRRKGLVKKHVLDHFGISCVSVNNRNFQPVASTQSLLFDLLTVRTATNDFAQSNKLGEGGFGIVYKGNLEDGQEIAVKRLSMSSNQGLNELKNEVFLLAKLQHRNLVRLLGVCMEEEEKLLIYEYIQNTSLDTFLFDPIKKEQLPWERRRGIIEGISRGMLYLHQESQIKIIHRDLKASNILLDARMNPKIADFGLARLFDGDQTHGNTNKVVGTFGYISPEYATRGHFSDKSDVFSLGVLILEIVTGKRNNDFLGSEDSTNLLSYVWEHWSSGTVNDIVDPSMARNYPRGEALRCIQIGLLCVQESPSERPTMSTIVLMLSSHSVSVCVPSRPCFFTGYSGGIPTVVHEGILLSRSTANSDPYTLNEVSITEMDVR